MSLTNPNSVVTEERLSDFYQGILPYLGGMPDILANKFDRSNLYSTDEKIVGRWIDGKPIYQKVFVSSNAFAIGTSWINTGWDVSFANVLVNTQIIDSVGQVFCGVNAGFISGNLGLQAFNTISNAKICILQYTKTADAPVEIGIDTDYSTTEKIVGTWIDGRPIYQKTISKTHQMKNNGAWRFDVPSNVDKFVDTTVNLILHIDNNDIAIIMKPYYESDSNYIMVNSDNLYIKRSILSENIYYTSEIITYQYTKTTD